MVQMALGYWNRRKVAVLVVALRQPDGIAETLGVPVCVYRQFVEPGPVLSAQPEVLSGYRIM